MRQRLPKVLVAAGAVVMVIGVVATVTMLLVHNRCQHAQNGYPDSPTAVAACVSYQEGADWAYAVVALGAVVIVGGALAATPLVQRRRQRAD